MREKISVDKAIKRGHLIVNLPVLITIIGIPSLAFFLNEQNLIPEWGIWVSFFLGIVLAWLIWSVVITKWRIWAFENVRNVHELKKRAIQENLIWNDGSIFEKTEIRNRSDKAKLEKIAKKFEKDDEYKEDHAVPKKTEIYYSKTKSYIELFISILIIGVGIYFFLKDENKGYVLGFIMILVGLYSSSKEIKKILNEEPQITIDDNGISTINVEFRSWNLISDEEVIQEGIGKSTKYFLFYFYEGQRFEKIDIASLNINRKKLENILRTYRLRYQKKI